ncbi:2',3'-cyclic-nucleotide 2'-phosphodiesterase (5'-nucleotidase family)/putative cell wall-binding protein [Microbacteriaceae bacterium SG_E_30_P1]|uniref:2',3'-cyclic-nucleotide 2'-phosphodiesterase (5'-nucleotidase family)/putative cell wall-binding protein n=1 Tax=Antiquaquibacter oligotrophicus TaxID=2880260 RepID=A0ABT6KTP3_9MICO|nr:cell wall-binding repeat-containing protein [Antiquaquibacter oligotrophicus]MDH6182559.1 2',3'-cyclic-nucleotide 2'-phosphodiesterase (5'-nucleotidase family)/putative cell wall-binding protein [Antiquaquibacter oligotrophicus]UDF14474.1 cell wall-binding repeat-containing protein [Antiquaquibacter oligotrophicus]
MRSSRSVLRRIAPAAVLALALTAVGTVPAAHAADPVTVDLLSINDFHGRLEASSPIAGAAVLAGMVDSYRAANPNTLFVGAGDLIGASTFTSFIQQDEPTIEALNVMGLDTSSFGNHEFDHGVDDVVNRIEPLTDWDYLAANLYQKGTSTPAFPEYFVQDFGGVSVGFVGAVTEELPSLVSPAGIASIDVGPVVPAVNRVADQLSDGNPANGEADVVILLVHEGAATTNIASATDDSPFGRIVTGANANVDAIISGHTHLAYNHTVPIPGTDKTRPVISSGQYGEKFAHSAIQIDPDSGEIVSFTTEIKNLFGAYAPNAEVAQIVADAVAVARERGSVKLGDITADLNRGVQSGGAENRGAESTLGNFVADVQLWATEDSGSQIAFMNPGGLRADLKYAINPTTPGDGTGVVTYSEGAAVQSFANTLVTKDMTGNQIKLVLEQQWQPSGAARPFLKLGISEGLTYTYDATAAAGSRITQVWLDGTPLDPTATYRVTMNSFLASGGDNFGAFAQGTNPADSGKVDLQSMVEYFEEFPVVSPDYTQRAVGVKLPTPDGDGFGVGDEVTLSLSSLLFSQDGPRTGTVNVSSEGTLLGSATIDPSIVDTTDEVGRASVTITVPLTTQSTLPLTITVPSTGTTTTVDLPVIPAEPERIGGANRYEVGVNISQASYPETAPVVYVANGENYPDALSAGPAAAFEGGPLLLVRPNEAPDAVLAEIERLQPSKIVVVGGTLSVTEGTFNDLKELADETVRITGANRYEVSRNIAEYAFGGEDVPVAYVATGEKFPDALSAGGAAGVQNAPVLLVRGSATDLDAATEDLLDSLGTTETRVLGGEASVSAGVFTDLAAITDATRFGGANRYEAARAINSDAFESADQAFLATGLNFPDALAGSAWAATSGSPLYVVPGNCITAGVLADLNTLGVSEVTLLGGEASLSPEVAELAVCQ